MSKMRFDARKAVAELSSQPAAVTPPKKKSKPLLGGVKIRLPFLRKKETFVRRHARYECCMVGELDVIERHFDMDGVILEISRGGALFRPASTFILDRTGERVRLRFEGIEIEGAIMSARPVGYGVKFDGEIAETDIDRLAAEFGLKTARAA